MELLNRLFFKGGTAKEGGLGSRTGIEKKGEFLLVRRGYTSAKDSAHR